MPEGDTIYAAARRIRGALVGADIVSVETPHPRFERDRWPERLGGRAVRAVDTRGKHLFIRFEGDLTLHSHLRMNGWWGVYERGGRWSKSPSRAWLVIRTDHHDVVQFGGPVLELMTDSRSRSDQRLAALGPDVLAPEFDARRFLARLRQDDSTRPIGDALLDQRNLAGIGNLYKNELCFLAGVHPRTPVADVPDLVRLVRRSKAALEANKHRVEQVMTGDTRRGQQHWVYRRDRQPCRRCGTRVVVDLQGPAAQERATYWCPTCQPEPTHPVT
jgi:endonuclease VIII